MTRNPAGNGVGFKRQHPLSPEDPHQVDEVLVQRVRFLGGVRRDGIAALN